MKKAKEKFDFAAFGLAIKEARKAKGYSRNELADELNIAPRYIVSIENSGQHPSLQIFYEIVRLDMVFGEEFTVLANTTQNGFPTWITFQQVDDYVHPVWPATKGEQQQMEHLDI